jgi:ABC-type polysaccharide/polyol phosphate transport system ATPase subunit
MSEVSLNTVKKKEQDFSICIDDVTKTYPWDQNPLTGRNHSRSLVAEIFKKKSLHKIKENDFCALKNISLRVRKGDSLGIIGLNGSGKSTLLQIIAGTLRPTSGEVKSDGAIGALLELGSGFNPDFTGKENIYLNGKIHGLNQDEVDQKYDAITTFSGIGEFVNQPVRTYSSGMVVRLAFSVIAHTDPDILIIDEALSVGDVRFQAKCFSFLESFRKKGKTLLFVSHDLNSIARLCTSAILLNKGKIYSAGTPKEIINEYSKIISEGTHSLNDVHTSSKNTKSETLNHEQQNDSPHDEFNYGGEKAEITTCQIFNERNIETTVVSSGENFAVRFNVHGKSLVEKPIYAITIRDPKGQQVYGQNTHFSKTPTESLGNGDETNVEFKLKANLGEGKYLLSFGVTQFKNNDLEVIHRRYDALEFQVINSDGSFGISNCFGEIYFQAITTRS